MQAAADSYSEITTDFVDMLVALIDKGNANIQDKYGKTALHYALEARDKLHEKMILSLINEKTNFKLRDEDGIFFLKLKKIV